MEGNNQLSFPEEEEDLEALRLAALQSLKRKTSNEIQPMGHFGKETLTHFNGSPRGKSKRGKFQRQIQGRSPRNGQFNGWTRNSNLIAVPMVTEEANPIDNKRSAPDDVPKLILPQDRYCKVEKTPEKHDTLTSKFDRYDNSDESDSDSEDETCKLETEDKPDLPRSNSLEALMAELENEIQGVSTKPEETPKPKPKKKRKSSVATPPKPAESKPPPLLKENLRPETHEPAPAFRQRKWLKPRRGHPPGGFPAPLHRPVAPPPEVIPPMVAFAPPPPVQSFPPFGQIGFEGVYVPPPVVFEAPPPQLPPMCVAPPVYERPLSPLAINTEYSTCTLAPLSPRSAAFVMENRAIVEKRKRRSWSRSPSPGRFRRSRTPKRMSLSPNRPARSPKRRSLSPSPVRKVLLPRTNSPKKPPIHDRLGLKSTTTKVEPDDENKVKDAKKEETREVLDPVLEARRKKFERKEITMTEGVIRLKKEKQEEIDNAKKEETKTEDDEEDIDEDALLEGDGDPEDSLLLDHKIDALFSDEESDSDNEGRFKTKQESSNRKNPNQKVAVLPFNKLINGSKGDAKAQPKAAAAEKKNDRSKGGDRRKRFRSRTPAAATTPTVKRISARAPKKTGDKVKQPIGFANERKIEIKIRNPAKYEKGAEEKARKVEVAKKEDPEGEKVEESAEEAANANITEGDLRAQLSRKRAERQKHPLPDVVPTRLLQNALQGVGFRKGKKSKSKDENSEGKLPIHLRLGAATASPELFGKKSRKHKNKGASQEQV